MRLNLIHKQQAEAQTIVQNALSEVQSNFYDIESEINRFEQSIEHTNERHKQLEDDLEQIKIKWAETLTVQALREAEEQLQDWQIN